MYLPTRFEEKNAALVRALVQEHPFAMLVTAPSTSEGPAVPYATHLPLLLDETRGVLRGHMARANPQWRHFGEAEVLAVFSGPHAFVSSMWSEEPREQVPTWNYVVAHAYGRPRVLAEEAAALAVLGELVAAHQPEGSPVPLDPPAELARELVRAIVAFEIQVTRWEAKSKLSQNRTPADRLLVEQALSARGARWDAEIAERMRRQRLAG